MNNFIGQWFQRNQPRLRDLFILVVMSMLANVYFIANYAPSIDSELAAVRTDSSVWIMQGRFTTFLIEKLLFPQPSLPFSPYVFLALMTGVTHVFLMRAHRIAAGGLSYVTYGLFITYPTWWLIQEFPANVPATGIGFLLVATALLLQSDKTDNPLDRYSILEVSRICLIGLLLGLAAGTYQTLLLLFVCGIFGTALCKSLQRSQDSLRKIVIVQIFHGGICLTCGALFYIALNQFALKLSGTTPEYVAEFVRADFRNAPIKLVSSIAEQALKTYSGSATLFGAAMPIAIIVILCAAIAVMRRQFASIVQNLSLFSLILLAPFAICLLTGADGVPLRAMVALPYVIWLSAILIFTFQRGILLAIGVFVCAIFQLQIINLTSQYVATATLVKQQDRFMGFEIGHRILQLRGESGVETPIEIDVYGHGEMYRASLFAAASSGVTRGSFFGWDHSSIWRIAAYLRVLGFDSIKPAPEVKRKQLTKYFEQMTVWPQEGSIRRVDNYYLLKLGDRPDAAHTADQTK